MSRKLSMDRTDHGSTGIRVNRCLPCAIAAISACGLLVSPAAADIDPLSGIDFVHITDPGNAPWMGNPGPGIPGDNTIGRGGVGYNYYIGRTEVTTGQWVEFFNAAYDRPANDRIPHLLPPDPGHWGAVETTPNTPGGRRWVVPAGNQLRAVGDISWRMAAIFCNWLHNGKSSERAAFLDGAYDVSTFGFVANPGLQFTDQFAHHPDARYWIPNWDEWLKAAHYDPDKNGSGQGGWWMFPDGGDEPIVYGPPGQGEANAHFSFGSEFAIPLGAYPEVTSPWGLLDVAGGTSEWTESWRELADGRRFRFYEGSSWAGVSPHPRGSLDWIQNRGGELPHVATFDFGLRVASAVPAPSAWWMLVGSFLFPCVCGRNRRRQCESNPR